MCPTQDELSIIEAIANTIGPAAVLADGPEMDAYVADWRGLHRGRALCVARPANVDAVASVVRICADRAVEVVPQGGNTSMVDGATPDGSGRQVVLSLKRLNRIRSLDPIDMSMTLEAGVVVHSAQEAAREAGFAFPLSFSAEGSATVGGALSTNAGGNNTVRYGNARDQMLGLEVVLPDGRVWNGLRSLRKDNTGYALRHLFAGAEGTLGIITAAVIKLVARPRHEELVLCAVRDENAALALFRRFRDHDESSVRAFEYMSGFGTDLVLKHIEGAVLPLDGRFGHLVLVDLASGRSGIREEAETILGDAMEGGEVLDAVIAASVAQHRAIWRLREEHSEAQKREGASVKNDVSVPVARVPELMRRAAAECEAMLPGVRPAFFGHIGDGNIHVNFLQPEAMSANQFLGRSEEIMTMVAEIVRDLDGSFSAEHGIGRLKTHMLEDWRSGPELDLMFAIKLAIDPGGLFNPGKVLRR